MRLVATYNLKHSVKLEEFVQWSREVDQKITSKQPGYQRIEVFEVKAVLEGSKPPYKSMTQNVPYRIVEFIEVESQEALEHSQRSLAMSEVMKQWLKFVDESSVVIMRVEKIE